MAVTNQQVLDFLLATPNMSDAQIFAAMRTFGVPPSQMSAVSGVPVNDIIARIAPLLPQNEAVLLGDTWMQASYRTTGSGETQEIGPLENIYVSKTTGGVNDKQPVGTPVQVYGPSGEFVNTIKTKKDLSFVGGLVEALKDPVVLAALGGAAAGGLLGGTAAGTAGATAGLTATELAAYDLALGGAGGTTGAASLGSALTTGATVPTLTNLTGGSGLLTGEAAGITAQSVADKLAADAAAQASAKAAKVAADAKAIADAAATADAATKAAADAAAAKAAADAATAKAAADAAAAKVATDAAAVKAAADAAATTKATADAAAAAKATADAAALAKVTATTLTTTELANAAKLGLTAAQYAQLFSSTAQTAAGLLQQQTSKEAADKARAMIDTETAAAKASAQFRPIGMTTRFGTSQFQRDPVTGQLTSAGYTLSPEAKNAQDRFLTLAGAGLTQAEGAQQAFAPLQTGAQSLFSLGNQYLAKTPQDVAQNYLNQQMALLQPGRELELANLQNKLTQQGRGGLSVAQGGTMGATTPELQALYNARAQQEAQLAANAQQFGQQQVQFGAGLLGTGAQTMGQYYGGQQAAYAPYTTAFGQMQALEAAGQQPLQMGIELGKIGATTGFDAGRLGLQGAGQSVALATGPAATNNPYATLLSGAASSPALSEAAVKAFGGLFSGVPATTAMSALPTTFGTGSYYGSQDLGLFL